MSDWRVAHDLAADWSWMKEAETFRVRGGRVEWDTAEYVGPRERLRISRVVPAGAGVRSFYRYVDPETPIVLTRTGGVS